MFASRAREFAIIFAKQFSGRRIIEAKLPEPGLTELAELIRCWSMRLNQPDGRGRKAIWEMSDNYDLLAANHHEPKS
jgi:hypothetical protein